MQTYSIPTDLQQNVNIIKIMIISVGSVKDCYLFFYLLSVQTVTNIHCQLCGLDKFS